jgi:hypothetical protein
LGLSYSVRDYAMLALVSLIVSLGTAGVPGTSTVVTAAVLTAVGLPLQVLVLVIPISAIADTGRTATNITAAMVASAIVARKEGLLDDAIFNDERDYAPTMLSVANDTAGGALPADARRLKPVPQPSDPAEPFVPVGDAAYAALAAEMVGETCPF